MWAGSSDKQQLERNRDFILPYLDAWTLEGNYIMVQNLQKGLVKDGFTRHGGSTLCGPSSYSAICGTIAPRKHTRCAFVSRSSKMAV